MTHWSPTCGLPFGGADVRLLYSLLISGQSGCSVSVAPGRTGSGWRSPSSRSSSHCFQRWPGLSQARQVSREGPAVQFHHPCSVCPHRAHGESFVLAG